MKKPHTKSHQKKKSKSNLGDRIRDAKVTFSDMKKAMEAVDALSEEDRKDFTGRSIAVMRAFGLMTGDRRIPSDKHQRIEKVTAVQIRMEAMSRLLDQKRLEPWTMASDQEGMTFISEYLLRVAAEAPLLGGKEGPSYFDADDFSRRVLEIAEQEGTA